MGYQAYSHSQFCPIDSFQYDKSKGFFCSSFRYISSIISSITIHFSSMVDIQSPHCIHVHHISFFITIEPSSSVSIHLSCAMNIWKFIRMVPWWSTLWEAFMNFVQAPSTWVFMLVITVFAHYIESIHHKNKKIKKFHLNYRCEENLYSPRLETRFHNS
jgi:hypothetical protein